MFNLEEVQFKKFSFTVHACHILIRKYFSNKSYYLFLEIVYFNTKF